jgi:hypothetical protein
MKKLLMVAGLGVLFGVATPALAKKKPPKSSGSVKTSENDKNPSPGDKGTNEGAQGRQNATEDAARAAEGSNNSRGR